MSRQLTANAVSCRPRVVCEFYPAEWREQYTFYTATYESLLSKIGQRRISQTGN